MGLIITPHIQLDLTNPNQKGLLATWRKVAASFDIKQPTIYR